jgi:hypothetical protein
MKSQDFLGPKTIAVAAGIPPMGTIFTTVPRVDYRTQICAQLGLPWEVAQGPVVPLKIHLAPKAPHGDCSA